MYILLTLTIIFGLIAFFTPYLGGDDYVPLTFISTLLSIIGLISLAAVMFAIRSSEKRADYLNKTYGLHYTADDIYWNGSLITAELRVKGIILDKNQTVNLNLNK